jgi:hypothetical protein
MRLVSVVSETACIPSQRTGVSGTSAGCMPQEILYMDGGWGGVLGVAHSTDSTWITAGVF